MIAGQDVIAGREVIASHDVIVDRGLGRLSPGRVLPGSDVVAWGPLSMWIGYEPWGVVEDDFAGSRDLIGTLLSMSSPDLACGE